MNVGFYYMANAGGRLTGTVLSGALYQWRGLEACLWASAACVVLAGLPARLLPDARAAREQRLSSAGSSVGEDKRQEVVT